MSSDALLDWLSSPASNEASELRRFDVLQAATEALGEPEARPMRSVLRLTSPRALAVVTALAALTCGRGLTIILSVFRPELVLLGLLPLGAVVPAYFGWSCLRRERDQLVRTRGHALIRALFARRADPAATLRTVAAVTSCDEIELRQSMGLAGVGALTHHDLIQALPPAAELGRASRRGQLLCIVAAAWCSITFWSLYTWSMLGAGLER